MTAFVIARLPTHPQSLVVVECLQKSNISYRINTNAALMEFLMASGGGEGRLMSATALQDDFEPGKKKIHIIDGFLNIFDTVIKVEMESNENPLPNERIIKEEDETSESSEPNSENDRLETPSDAAHPLEPMEVPMAAPRNPSHQAEDEVVDDHQKVQDEEMDSFLNQRENDGRRNDGVLLTADPEFNENHTEMPFDLPLTLAEHGIQPVQADVEGEGREEHNVLGEKETPGDERGMEDRADHDMTGNELLDVNDLDVSMVLEALPHHDDDIPSQDVTQDEDLQMRDEMEIMYHSKYDDEQMEVDDNMEEYDEEEEEELIEEHEHERMEQPIESSYGDDMDDDEKGDSDKNEGPNDDDGMKQNAEKTKRSRSSANPMGRRLFSCPVKTCPLSFNTFNKLYEHVKTHPGKQDFFCNVCKKNFPSKNDAVAHIQERKKSECCECGKKLPTSGSLLRHLRCHSGEKPFVCKTCGKRFAQSNTLKRHVLGHTGEKPFKCDHCDYRSARKEHLKIHNRIHTGDKPYLCLHCKKRFAFKHRLKSHELTHTGKSIRIPSLRL